MKNKIFICLILLLLGIIYTTNASAANTYIKLDGDYRLKIRQYIEL